MNKSILLPLITAISLFSAEYHYDLPQNSDGTFSRKILLEPSADLASVEVQLTEREGSSAGEKKALSIPGAVNDLTVSGIVPKQRGDFFYKTAQLGVYKLLDLVIYTPGKYSSVRITVGERESRSTSGSARKEHGEFLRGRISNPEQLDHYSERESRSSSKPGYAILIPDTLVASLQNLQAFIELKEAKGFTVHLVTSSMWGAGVGDEAAENIRKWIDQNYETLNLSYIFFIGYPHPERGDVPMKMTWPQFQMDEYREAPTDFYYAELTGNWDVDNDGNYGEFEDDFMVSGGPDQYAELNIGRLPVYSKTKTDHILSKLIRYGSEPQGSAESWRSNTLLAMNNMNDESDPAFTPGIRLAEAIKYEILEPNGFGSYRIFDDNYEGFGLQTPAERTPCDYASVKQTWNSYDFGLVVWQAHGFVQHATDVMSIPFSKVLNDERNPFVFSGSCHNGRPESDNLSMYLLQNGAINVVSASRVEFWAPGQDDFWDSWPTGGSFSYCYTKNLVEDSLPSAVALNKLKADISTEMIQLNSMWWMNWLVYNVYGDPSQGLYSFGKDDATAVIPSNLKESRAVSILNNPVEAGGSFQFSVTEGDISTISVTLYDYLGNRLISKSFDSVSDESLFTLDLPQIKSGSVLAVFKLKQRDGSTEIAKKVVGVRL